MYKILEDMIIESKMSEDEIVILSLATGDYLGISGVALIIWNMIKAGKSEEEIISFIVSNYDVGSKEAESDVFDFINGLIEAKVIERE